MFSHVVVGSNDLARSKIFYDAVLAVLGAAPGEYDAKGRLIYVHGGSRFLITTPVDGAPAVPGNGHTLGFAMESPEQARAWHAAGVANGGTTAEDPPGVRHMPVGEMYLAYLRDPDGNKLCGRHRLGA
jgi:catechol 2,3-dioxygenase-like lactoylglutathione lyase family enzyme